jgi:hypothetical protein
LISTTNDARAGFGLDEEVRVELAALGVVVLLPGVVDLALAALEVLAGGERRVNIDDLIPGVPSVLTSSPRRFISNRVTHDQGGHHHG